MPGPFQSLSQSVFGIQSPRSARWRLAASLELEPGPAKGAAFSMNWYPDRLPFVWEGHHANISNHDGLVLRTFRVRFASNESLKLRTDRRPSHRRASGTGRVSAVPGR